MTTIALNEQYPDIFEGLDYKASRELINEACFTAVGEVPTEAELRHVRGHIGAPLDIHGAAVCPQCNPAQPHTPTRGSLPTLP